MCGRFSLHTPIAELQLAFKGFTFPADVEAHYNIAPSFSTLHITNESDRRVSEARWGLVPFWAKDPKIGNRMINARSETLTSKPAFREAFRSKRCLILADLQVRARRREPRHVLRERELGVHGRALDLAAAAMLVEEQLRGWPLLVLVADSAVRVLPLVTELRLGIALSLLGAPFFLALLLRMRRGLPGAMG